LLPSLHYELVARLTTDQIGSAVPKWTQKARGAFHALDPYAPAMASVSAARAQKRLKLETVSASTGGD